MPDRLIADRRTTGIGQTRPRRPGPSRPRESRQSPKGERAGEDAELRSCLCGPCFASLTMAVCFGPLNFASDHSPDLRFPFKACARPGSAARVQASSGGGRVGRRLLISPVRNFRRGAVAHSLRDVPELVFTLFWLLRPPHPVADDDRADRRPAA